MIVVRGRRQNEDHVLTMKGELPLRFEWDVKYAQSKGRPVGYPHWKRVPSLDDGEGFVAAAVWWLDRVYTVEGFVVPEPDEDKTY